MKFVVKLKSEVQTKVKSQRTWADLFYLRDHQHHPPQPPIIT